MIKRITIPNAIILVVFIIFCVSGIGAIFTWRQSVVQNEVFNNITRISMYTAQNATTLINTSSSIQHNLRLMRYLQLLVGDSWGSALEIREFYETEIRSIERMINTNPLLRNIRIYVEQDGVLELFPVVYNMARAGDSAWVAGGGISQSRWYFNYADTSLNSPVHNSEKNLVANITNVHIGGYRTTFEIAASMNDFIPGLFSNTYPDSVLIFVDKFGIMHYNHQNSLGISPSQIAWRINFGGGFQSWQGLFWGFPVIITYVPIDTPLIGGILEIRDISAQRNVTWLLLFLFISAMFLVSYLFIKISANENMKKELAAKDAQIMSLNNQIDSHFLYNTLESIKMLAEIDENYYVSDAITNLGKMFRYNLGRSATNDQTTIEAEIEYVQEYMALCNLRFDYEVPVIIESPENLLKNPLPRMTLQPIVENSITHGQRVGLMVTISVSQKKDNILIEVKDNGLGITPQTLEQLRDSLKNGKTNGQFGLGLANVYQRLTMHHGKDCSITIDSVPHSYTSVVLVLPKPQKRAGAATL